MQLEGIHMLSLDLSPLDDIACDWMIVDELNAFVNPQSQSTRSFEGKEKKIDETARLASSL